MNMVLKLIEATQAKSGTTILIDGDAYTVRSNDISKTGKHGHAKCRIEAVGIFISKKKVVAVNGSERFEVPLVVKHKAQVLSSSDGKASVMDLESYETIDLDVLEDIKGEMQPETQVEYWDIEGVKKIMRVL
jgi:translation initiation factor 5A